MPDGLAPADPTHDPLAAAEDTCLTTESLGVKPADIKYVAVSHTHPDHIGNVELFRRRCYWCKKPNMSGRTR